MKVVINVCYGGFSLSDEALKWLKENKGIEQTYHGYQDNERNDPNLVECVETLGKASWGPCAELRVVEIPDGVDWRIDEYDGNEHVEEAHRTWR